FFQAEDGIRDRNVTGVQTCALPISRSISPAPMHWPAIAVIACPIAQQCIPAKVLIFSPTPEAAATAVPNWFSIPVMSRYAAFTRSEERRVGKECRSRGARGHAEERC